MTLKPLSVLRLAEITAYSQAAVAVHWAARIWTGAVAIRMRAIADDLEAKAQKLKAAHE